MAMTSHSDVRVQVNVYLNLPITNTYLPPSFVDAVEWSDCLFAVSVATRDRVP